MNTESIQFINTLFSLGTLGFMACSLLLLIGILSKDKGPIFSWVAKNSLILVLLISLAGVTGSLIYQYGIGFAPCVLCWYQRIVLYPIAIISLVALIKKHSHIEVSSYAMVLAIIGLVIAAYHNFEKIMGEDLISCDAFGASCLQNYVKGFGFIDIPVMSLVFFILIILIIATRKRFTTSH